MASSSIRNASYSGNYTGELAAGYIAPAVLSANTIAQGAVTVHENVAYRLNVRRMTTTGFLQAGSCDFSSSGTVALNDVVLEPTELAVNLELCKKDFDNQWEAAQRRGSWLGQEVPQEFETFLVDRLNALTAKDIETKIWQGAANTGGDFIGLFSRLASDSDVVTVSGTTITAANVIGEIAKVVDAIPEAIYSERGDNGVRILVGIKTAKLYQRALGYGIVPLATNLSSATNNNSYNNVLSVGEKPMDFEGIPIVVCNGMGDNKMVASVPGNLHFGTNVLTDFTEMEIIDRAPIDGSRNFRFVQRFTCGTQITNGAEIVYYTA